LDEKEGKYGTRFYEYTSDNFKHLDPTIVSSKYFDQDFDPSSINISDWADIPTPHMESVMNYQGFSKDVCKWLYVFCGRLCFDLNDLDSWQVIPFLKGIARSGKSTIITKICKKFYEGQDVRTLSNNIEKKFGLESIYDGFMFIAPEIKGDMALEQAEFQSLVSGEDMSIARKNKTAQSLTWKVPGILAGNEVPNWRDNSGSVLRRLVTWNFGRQVAEADPHLDDKLDAEMATILCKCVRAYLDYSQRYSDQDIWNVLPKYFIEIQNQVAMVTNTLQHFLASENVVYGKNLCCPQKMFVTAFNQHCQANNLGKPRFNPDFYAGPFSSRQVDVRPGTVWREQTMAVQPFVYGLDLAQDLNAVI
jgi:phage/plasmid-associated DNA primase